MHPAYSVILFTTAAGAGYGLLVWLAVAVLLGAVLPFGATAAAGLVLALGLVTLGLLSSTLHLGRPERAWRALSQWSTSWLSREGVLALATYVPSGLWLLIALAAPSGGWWFAGALLGLASAVGALATVAATGMIYQSLPTIRAWSDPLVTPVYILLSLATGAALMALLVVMAAAGAAWIMQLGSALLVLSAVVKWTYWRRIDTAPRTWTAEAATGLGSIGRVRPLDPPHTQPNFVMREMGYRVARKHAQKLRLTALLAGFLAPAVLLLLAGATTGVLATLAAAVAVVCVGIGAMVERWLFFAEAEHVVMLYYGAERV
ncbi:MAG: DmsC/YnfH family molybdoenzyme membrane anchor subunit [Hyphomicrobiaceae bacterium]|nr:DmsC/YnfH family molybdoenzyme membrane anchor subunit [Hyphomicrobiaceae bacterium]